MAEKQAVVSISLTGVQSQQLVHPDLSFAETPTHRLLLQVVGPSGSRTGDQQFGDEPIEEDPGFEGKIRASRAVQAGQGQGAPWMPTSSSRPWARP